MKWDLPTVFCTAGNDVSEIRPCNTLSCHSSAYSSTELFDDEHPHGQTVLENFQAMMAGRSL
jgi:hypothetical protein